MWEWVQGWIRLVPVLKTLVIFWMKYRQADRKWLYFINSKVYILPCINLFKRGMRLFCFDLVWFFFLPHLNLWDLSFPIRDWTLNWKHGVLTTGSPGKLPGCILIKGVKSPLTSSGQDEVSLAWRRQWSSLLRVLVLLVLFMVHRTQLIGKHGHLF